jgi:hypothetical protein
MQWLEIVHTRLFQISAHAEVPIVGIKEALWKAGIKPPEMCLTFMLSSELSDQYFANLVVHTEPRCFGTMPWGCTFYVNGKKSSNCRVDFDAGLYDRNDMQMLLDRYVRLLEASARAPELPLGTLQTMIGAKPRRWAYTRYAGTLYDFIKPYYDSSPRLQTWWRRLKQRRPA